MWDIEVLLKYNEDDPDIRLKARLRDYDEMGKIRNYAYMKKLFAVFK